ncbi:mannose-binding lectin [Amniculicola lignicola CBS 123094]|uniref:Mannose-binding lectin n=1 Tax=Amniculicola lignicola CBS 123094 TaxID=1392246 RepID=A0A6A5WDJ1_9PLEO|nr:mannose-binding lectin [Amniculicola lignicola CBS 123094]
MLAALALFPLVIPALAATTTGAFDTLSFNVAGLPAILNSNDVPGDKTTNTASIGKYLASYDFSLIHVQEDFNYHATLYANDNHPYRTATSGGVPFGSGLNTLSNFNWTDFTRVKWSTCSDASGSDCLTPKGFTFMRVHVSEGVWVDAYNLHSDAGTEPADLVARASNLQQVSAYISTYSTGNPVIVFGDTNSRYTRVGDVATVFNTANGMTDAWVQLAKGGVAPVSGSADLVCSNPSPTTDCEIVDKLWYRGSPAVALTATKFQYAGSMFLQADGNVLSDHDPILVDFSWSLGTKLRVSDYFGGDGGSYFTDLQTVDGISSPTVSSITLRGGERLDSVSITLSSAQTFTHGGTGGTATTLKLNSGEKVTSATLCQGFKTSERLFYLQLTTSSGRSVAAGTMTNDCVVKTADSGWSIVGFLGKSGDAVDRLGFVYSK